MIDAPAPALTVGVPRETDPRERRVALVPASVPALTKAGLGVLIERGAGVPAGFEDAAFASHGARLVDPREARGADVVVRVRGWGIGSDAVERPGQVAIGMADPLGRIDVVRQALERKLTAFALDLMPRITRAQAMDVLSSQATAVGYGAVILAASRSQRMFPMMTTAAGTLPPAQVLVLGAGVAGLQAIATARRLGAVVEAYDVRPAAHEDIESLGARPLSLPLEPGDAEDASGYAKDLGEAFFVRQQSLLAEAVAGVDVVVCTAQIPGRPSPLLLTEEAVGRMRAGSVIVDCAAERGGNCALTRADEELLTAGEVTVLGPTDLASSVPHDASAMFSRNATAFLELLVRDGRLVIDREDEIVRGTLVVRDGELVHEGVIRSLEVQLV
jgi:proton-translocating NAD(P)+ transhydrogenase subunit alpha